MDYLTEEQCKQWATQRGFMPRPDLIPFWGRTNMGFAFTSPSKAAELIALAEGLTRAFSWNQVLVWTTDWPMYTEMEMQHVLSMRTDCKDRLIDKPGEVCNGTVRISEWIFVLMAFNWSGYILSEAGDSGFYIGDEVCEVFTSEPTHLEILTEYCDEFGLHRWT